MTGFKLISSLYGNAHGTRNQQQKLRKFEPFRLHLCNVSPITFLVSVVVSI